MVADAILHCAALKQLLEAKHPNVWLRHQADWRAWLQERQTRLPNPSLPRAYVAVAINSISEIPLHAGLLQLLHAPGLTAVVVLVLPTRHAAVLAHNEAMLGGWGQLVTIMTAADWIEAAARLPASSHVIQFFFPAAFAPFEPKWERPSAWDDLMASAQPSGSVTVGLATDVGERDMACSPPDLGTSFEALIKAASISQGINGESADPASSVTAQSNIEALYRPHSLILSRVSKQDLIAVTTETNDGQTVVTALRAAGLHDSSGALTAALPPRLATIGERRLDIRVLSQSGEIRGCQASLEISPNEIEPWMLSAYLNRGGGGNPVAAAFARGAGCRLAYAEDELARPEEELRTIPVVWGVLRGSDAIVAKAKSQDLPFYYIDHAYFDRGHGHSYRITYCGYEAGPVRRASHDRLRKLGLTIQPWRKSGRTIIVCPPTDYFAAAHGCLNWLDDTLAQLRFETDRPIVVRNKPQPGETPVPLAEALANAHALVTHSSNVAIEAACLGTPVFVAPTSAAAPIGCTDLSRIEEPRYPNRENWLAHLAYSQFTIEEFASGEAWKIMRSHEGKEYV